MTFNASIPQTFEAALVDVIQQQEPGATVIFRCWHNLRNDHRWTPQQDRTLPQIEIRCSPPAMEPTQVTQACSVMITCMSDSDDDPDHSQINQMEEAVTATLDKLQHGFVRGGEAWCEFCETLQELRPDVDIGGIIQGEPSTPMDGDGINAVAFSVNFAFCRNFTYNNNENNNDTQED